MSRNAGAFQEDDELDLELIVLKGMSFFKTYRWMLAVTTLAGLFAAITLYKALPKRYSSRLILESTLLSNLEEMQLIDSWNGLLTQEGRPALAESFNCSTQVIERLKSIKAEQIQKGAGNDATSGFIVEVMVSDTGRLDELQKGIIYGLENSYYVKQRVEIRKANLEQLIRGIKNEMSKLDSVKSTVGEIIENRRKTSSTLMVDVSEISTGLITLQEKLLAAEENLKFVTTVHLLQPFSTRLRLKEPKLLTLLFIGLAGGFGIGYVGALYRIFRRKYQVYARQQAGPPLSN